MTGASTRRVRSSRRRRRRLGSLGAILFVLAVGFGIAMAVAAANLV